MALGTASLTTVVRGEGDGADCVAAIITGTETATDGYERPSFKQVVCHGAFFSGLQ